ncbi:ATP-binding protein [Streptomyces tendae]|uniref:ATP-binding protein n=1 Tax=Streptomyces tendae TaxID=1932 RepID=UPI0036BC32CF
MQPSSEEKSSCENCGIDLRGKKGAGKGQASVRYCSNACRQRAYRRRQKVGAAVVSTREAAQLTSLVGRDHDIAELRRTLKDTRLLTITGAPGVGKSRVAMEIIRKEQNVSHREAQIIDFCQPEMISISPESLPSLLEESIVGRMMMESGETGWPGEQLVLLENCDRVIEFCGPTVVALLFRFPGLRVVSSSREPWRISGEAVYRLAGLSLPRLSDGVSLEKCMRANAVRLFVSRCKAVNNEFELTEGNLTDVRDVCISLDGIPLALEVTAQLARALPIATIRNQLRDGTATLNQAWRTTDARHRDWWHTVQWSYDYLTVDEKRLYRRLCAIPNSFGVEAAEAAYTDDPKEARAVTDMLVQLEAKSLLWSCSGGSQKMPAFIMPNPLRVAVRQNLLSVEEEAGVLDRTVKRMVELADNLSNEMFPSVATLNRLDHEREHLRFLLTRLDGTSNASQLPLTLVLAALANFRGENTDEALTRIQDAMSVTNPGSERCADAFNWALELACWYGHDREATCLAPEAVSSAILTQDDARIARALLLSSLCKEMYTDGDDTAIDDLKRSISIAERRGFRTMLAACLSHLARHRLRQGSPSESARLLESTIPTLRQFATGWQLSSALLTAGAAALEREQVSEAEKFFQEILTLPSSPGLYDGVLGLALCATFDNRFERALKLISTIGGEPLTSFRLFPSWKERMAEVRRIAIRILSPARANAALTAGAQLDISQIVNFALDDYISEPRARNDDILTAREWNVLELVMKGMTNVEIAHRLHLSVRTVETHIRSIRTTLGLRSRAHMAAWAVQNLVETHSSAQINSWRQHA